MYSLSPVADLSNIHFGFYLVASVLGAVAVYQLKNVIVKNIRFIEYLGIVLVLGIVVGFSALCSYGDEAPLNTRVVATFVGYEPLREKSQSGKYTTVNDIVYGRFSVQGGDILLKVDAQSPIPKYVYLYKN